MTQVLARLERTASDLIAASRLMRNPIAAFRFFRSATASSRLGTFRTGPLTFVARKEDWVGVREIFVENEYDILDTLLKDVAAPLANCISSDIALDSCITYL